MDAEPKQYLDAKFSAIDGDLGASDTRFAAIDAELGTIKAEFKELEERIMEGLDRHFRAFERRMKDYISASGRDAAARITAEFYKDGPYPERRTYLPPSDPSYYN